jgi:hypothetical protein
MNQGKATTRCRSVLREKDYHAWGDRLPRDTLNLSDTRSARVRILTTRISGLPLFHS